jgi:hypothetical protein
MSKKDKKDLLKWQIKLIKEVMKNSPKKEYTLKLKDFEAELKILRRKS